MAVTINASTSAGLVQTADLSGSLQLQTAGTTAITVDASQNVGMGISSPVAKLDILGSAGAANRSLKIKPSSNGADIPNLRTVLIENASNDGALVSGFSTATDAWVISSTYGSTGSYKPLAFATSDTERMRLDTSGNLLVGTTTTSNTNGLYFGKGGAAGGGIINVMKTATGATQSLLNFYGSTYVGGINYDNTSTSFPTSSDVRLKKNIVDAPSAINKINNIHIVSHGWKHDDAIVEYGVIAQELINVAPQAVTKGDDNEEIELTWTVDYSKLVPMLTKAIQELNAKVEALEAQLGAKL